MSFLRPGAVYAVCALIFIYYQTNRVSAVNCASCNNTENSLCTADSITNNSQFANCSSNSLCFEVLYKDKEGGADQVLRGCDFTCTSKELLKLNTTNFWSCKNCTTDFCNTASISYNETSPDIPDNSSSSALISNFRLGSLMLSAAVTFYLY